MLPQNGSQRFSLIAVGQLLSVFGSALSGFGLGVWVFQETGSVLQFGMISLVFSLPGTLLAPFAGALVDRWNHRWTMLGADLVAASGTLPLFVLVLFGGNLEIWHVYVLSFLSSVAGVFQWPAFYASVPMLLPKEQFARAAGFVRVGGGASRILAPLVAGVLLDRVGLISLLGIDLLTFAIAAITLLAVRIPRPPSPDGPRHKSSLWAEAAEGWRFISQRPGLRGLLLVFATINFGTGMVTVLITPLVLSFGPVASLGFVLSAGGAGTVLGGLLITFWGGPKTNCLGVVFASFAIGAAALSLAGLGPIVILVALGYFGYLFCIPVAQACNQAIWQTKVPLELQGRVVSIRRAIATASMPLAYLLGGPLADGLAEPMMAADGLLAPTIGQLIGVGPGRGIALLILFVAFGNLTALAVGWSRPQVRHLEDEIPDAVGPKGG